MDTSEMKNQKWRSNIKYHKIQETINDFAILN